MAEQEPATDCIDAWWADDELVEEPGAEPPSHALGSSPDIPSGAGSGWPQIG